MFPSVLTSAFSAASTADQQRAPCCGYGAMAAIVGRFLQKHKESLCPWGFCTVLEETGYRHPQGR